MNRASPIALLAALSGLAHAGGFEILEQSPSGTAMAGAVSAKADDPSAIFYNPAGIAARDGDGVQLGATIAFTSFLNRDLSPRPVTTSTSGGVQLLPQLYASTHFGPRLAFGIGLFPQFGAGARWNAKGTATDATGATVESPFPGRFVAQNTQIQTITLNPTIALRASERISFGAGVDLVFASVELERSIQFADFEGSAHLGGATRGFGFNAGVLVEAVPNRLSVALAYRSAVDLTFGDLKADFTGPPELKDQVYDQKARTALTLPHNVTFGLATFPTRGLVITTDVHFTMWSDFREIAVTFPDGKTPGFSAPQRWRDSFSARTGAEYLHALGPGRIALRIGFGYDLTPVPANTLNPAAPLTDLLILSAGVGYGWRGFALNAGYVAGLAPTRSSTNPDYPSEYHGSLSALSLSLSYQWGRDRL